MSRGITHRNGGTVGRVNATFLLAFLLLGASSCDLMMQPSSRSDTSIVDPFGRGPGSSPEVITPVPDPFPEPSPDPGARSQLIDADCPWGADTYPAARLVEHAGY